MSNTDYFHDLKYLTADEAIKLATSTEEDLIRELESLIRVDEKEKE